MNLNGWESIMFVGVNAAISNRISNELGSGRPRTTMYSIIVVIITSLAIGLLCMVSVLALRDYFSVIFTSDKDMQRAVSKMVGLLGLTMVLNSIQPVISGVAVGGGWQALVAYINLGCYYVFGLPVGFVFGYLIHWGVEGIWIGMLCGIALQTLVLLLVIWKMNRKDEVVDVGRCDGIEQSTNLGQLSVRYEDDCIEQRQLPITDNRTSIHEAEMIVARVKKKEENRDHKEE